MEDGALLEILADNRRFYGRMFDMPQLHGIGWLGAAVKAACQNEQGDTEVPHRNWEGFIEMGKDTLLNKNAEYPHCRDVSKVLFQDLKIFDWYEMCKRFDLPKETGGWDAPVRFQLDVESSPSRAARSPETNAQKWSPGPA